MRSKIIGSIMILTGTAIGAGILAQPLVAGGAGFWYAALVLVVLWALMTYTGLLVLEVTLALEPYQNNFNSMAKHTLGRIGQVVTWFTVLLLLYSLVAAYMDGAGSILTTLTNDILGFHIPQWTNALLFSLIFGGAVYWSTHSVDLANRTLLSLKGVLLILALMFLMPHIDLANLNRAEGAHRYVWVMISIFLTAFGYHTCIPSLVNYLGKEVQTHRKIILWGATIPLVIYGWWLFVSIGLVPQTGEYSFLSLGAHDHSVGYFINMIDHITQNKWTIAFINGFSNIALTTSFLGVSLGLFDFLADGFKRANTRIHRTQTALLTFIPPFLFALIYPHGFVMALGYAAIFVAILEVILPPLMVWNYVNRRRWILPTAAPAHPLLLALVLLLGIAIIVIELLNS